MGNLLCDNLYGQVINALKEVMEVTEVQEKIILTTLHNVMDSRISVEHQDKEIIDDKVLIGKFITYKKMAGRQKSTLDCYEFTIKKFCEFTKIPLQLTTDEHITRYLLYLDEHGCNKKSQNNARRNLNVFFGYLTMEGILTKNPMAKIPAIKEDKRLRHFYSDLDMEKMRDACIDKREIALVDLLLSTGIRVSEVSKITMSDINWIEDSVLIHGKGGKDRVVFLSPRCKKHLQEYISSRNFESDHLLCGKHKPHKPLSTDSINKILGTIGERCGVGDISVHDFRRHFASDLSKKGVDEVVIQDLMGHSSFETTRSYYIASDMSKAKYAHRVYGC